MTKDVRVMIFSAIHLAIYAALFLPAAHCKMLLVDVQESDGLPQPESPAVPSRLRGTMEGDAVNYQKIEITKQLVLLKLRGYKG